jgi:hypothetical protein
MKRCKRCGVSDAHVSIYKETGLCMDCQTDWNLEQKVIKDQDAREKERKEKYFYKGF